MASSGSIRTNSSTERGQPAFMGTTAAALGCGVVGYCAGSGRVFCSWCLCVAIPAFSQGSCLHGNVRAVGRAIGAIGGAGTVIILTEGVGVIQGARIGAGLGATGGLAIGGILGAIYCAKDT